MARVDAGQLCLLRVEFMSKSTLLLLLLLLCMATYVMGRNAAARLSQVRGQKLNSLPGYYGYYVALWCGLPSLALVVFWGAIESHVITSMVVAGLPEAIRTLPADHLGLVVNEIRNAVGHERDAVAEAAVLDAARRYAELQQISAYGLALFVALASGLGSWHAMAAIHTGLRARTRVEGAVTLMLMACSTIAIFTTIGILLSVLFESMRFFQAVRPDEFLFGLKWSPQMAIRPDQVGSTGGFGAVPLFAGTFLISAVAMAVAVPIGLMSAIYLAEYATPQQRAIGKPLLEILAGIPTVVYGFFAALTVAPYLRHLGEMAGLSVSSESALAAGLVMGIMIIPFVSSLSDDFINAVPQSLRDGAYALGATQSETIRQVVIPAALPGIVGGVLLAISRAIGETMIVVMAAGLSAHLTINPLESVTTVTTQIVTLLVGDQEFNSPKTLAAFALGLMLFLATLTLNIIALRVVRKYREQYE
ncbi:MAG: phosphate transporter permease subunit PstC [Pseudomonadota bacterium]|jgi:phosphate transport system permease protein